MLVRFWGTRGSLPVAPTAATIQRKIVNALLSAGGRTFDSESDAQRFVEQELSFAAGATYGGATSCVEIEAGPSYFICDMGSGLRPFGLDSMKRNEAGHSKTYNFFQSHLHWDHIMGFPFFAPAFDPEATIRIHAGHPDAEEAFRRQQEEISFPVPFEWLRADIEFVHLTPGETHEVDGMRVETILQHHSHGSYGYRFTDGEGRTVIYSTDSEHKLEKMAVEAEFITSGTRRITPSASGGTLINPWPSATSSSSGIAASSAGQLSIALGSLPTIGAPDSGTCPDGASSTPA